MEELSLFVAVAMIADCWATWRLSSACLLESMASDLESLAICILNLLSFCASMLYIYVTPVRYLCSSFFKVLVHLTADMVVSVFVMRASVCDSVMTMSCFIISIRSSSLIPWLRIWHVESGPFTLKDTCCSTALIPSLIGSKKHAFMGCKCETRSAKRALRSADSRMTICVLARKSSFDWSENSRTSARFSNSDFSSDIVPLIHVVIENRWDHQCWDKHRMARIALALPEQLNKTQHPRPLGKDAKSGYCVWLRMVRDHDCSSAIEKRSNDPCLTSFMSPRVSMCRVFVTHLGFHPILDLHGLLSSGLRSF